MSDLYLCIRCNSTYFLYEGDKNTCPKCKIELIPICHWCNKPESECRCKKDIIEE